MKVFCALAMIALLTTAAPMMAETPAASAPAATQSAMPKELLETINNGIKLLEAGKHEEFVLTLAQPDAVDLHRRKGRSTNSSKSSPRKKPSPLWRF